MAEIRVTLRDLVGKMRVALRDLWILVSPPTSTGCAQGSSDSALASMTMLTRRNVLCFSATCSNKAPLVSELSGYKMWVR